MTRTDPPDILASTLFHNIISPSPSPSATSAPFPGPTHIPNHTHIPDHTPFSSFLDPPSTACNLPTMGTLPMDHAHEVINKRQSVSTLPLDRRHEVINKRQTVGTLPLDRRHDVINKRQTVGTLPLDHRHEVINKRHCRSFDFIESLDDPKCLAGMHSPDQSQEAEGHTGGFKEAGLWNGRPGHLRFSSPDLFNTKLPSQTPVATETVAVADGKGKGRSKSTPRVRTTLTPVPIPVSPPSGRRGKDTCRRSEVGSGTTAAPRDTSHPSQRALVNEVHPIKLQPQTPLYVSDCFEVPTATAAAAAEMKPSTSPHVRCRVDIKPDAAVLQHATRRPSAGLQRLDHAWQRSSVSLGPRHVHATVVPSRTPTPSECYEYRHPYLYPYPPCASASYAHLVDAPVSRAPSPRELAREYRTLSTPNIPTKFFYTEDAPNCGFPGPHSARTCYQDDQFSMTSSASHNPSLSGGSYGGGPGQDPRVRWVHTLPIRPCYGGEGRLRRDPSLEGWYQRPYSMTEPGPFYMPPPPPHGPYYPDGPRGMYPYTPEPPRVVYGRPCLSVAECSIPGRGYYPHPHGHPHTRTSQVFSESDWQRSSISGFSSHYGSSQATPQRLRHDPVLTPWYPGNEFGEVGRLGAEARHYSRSWDNILAAPPHEREREAATSGGFSFARGRSCDNLFNRPRHAPPPDPHQQQPVIVTLSSSPRRYAALSVSENSLDRWHGNSPRSSTSGNASHNWYVTPEITITDNDLRGVARHRKPEAPSTHNTSAPTTKNSVSWSVATETRGPSSSFPSHQMPTANLVDLDKDRKRSSYIGTTPNLLQQQLSLDATPNRYSLDAMPNRYSLQQSLEQLDELLADLVVDYKPPSSRPPSEDFLDQLKQLMTDDNDNDDVTNGNTNDAKCDTKPTSLGSQEQPMTNLPRDSSSSSAKTSPDTPRDPDSGCDGGLPSGLDELSPNLSPEEMGEGDGEDNSMTCSNARCGRKETLFHACLYFKSCHSCYTFYCSRRCRRQDWDAHKESCLYGRISSVCRHVLKHCRETADIHRSFSRVAKVGFLSRGRGVLFLGFPNASAADTFLKVGLESLLMAPTYLSLRELDSFKDNLGEYCGELTRAGDEYDPAECFLLNVSVAVGELVPSNKPSPRVQTPTVRKYAKVSLASSSPDKRVQRRESEMETLILTPPPGTTTDMDGGGEEGRKAREVCFINIQRELRTRGVFLRHEYAHIYKQLCEFVESNKRFTPTTIYPIDKRTGKQFMCMIMAASEPRTLDWVATPHLLDDII